ncbi:MAG: biotin/lipoyl-binding protein, partial [Planctomycetes bacterium]|nr:biotin/lipoyl-binding protein [Planctomycetota bacterium]
MKAKAVVHLLFTAILPLLIGLGVMVLIIAWLAGFFVEKIEPTPTIRVEQELTPAQAKRIDEVHEVEKEYFAEAVGTLRAATRTVIAARTLAPIIEIRVKAGDRVKQGDTLVLLDPRDWQTRLSQSKSALEAARVALAQADKDYKRDEQLFAERVLPAKQLEQSKTAFELAQAKVR